MNKATIVPLNFYWHEGEQLVCVNAKSEPVGDAVQPVILITLVLFETYFKF